MRQTIPREQALALLAFPAVLLLTYLASRAALTGPFVFDDYPNLANLVRLSGEFDLSRLADYLQSFMGNPGRPLSALSFLIDDAAWPSSPDGFKRTNLFIHLLCGVLVFGLARSLARSRLPERSANLAALLAASAWLLHPMQLSTSMLVVQRMTQLMTLVSLAGIWWASQYVQRSPLTTARSITMLAGTAFATVLAFLCKENGALLPLYVGVTVFVLLRPALAGASRPSMRLLLIGLALPIAAVVAQLAVEAFRYVPDGLRTFTPGERVLTQPRVLLEYLGRIAMPRLNGSGLFHDDYVASRGLLDPATTLPALLACLGLIGSALYLRRRAPLYAFAVLWFFGGHLIEASTLPLELYFEHRNYLPMVGPLIALTIWLAAPDRGKMRRIGLVALLAWIGLCAALTSVQARVWSSEAMLADIWAKENPRSVRAVELHAKVLADAGHPEAAHAWIERSMATYPEMRKLALDLVLLDCHMGRLTPEALARAAADVRTSEFNRSSLQAIATLQLSSQQGACEPILTPDAWQSLAMAMLANPVYANHRPAASFLWVEIAKSRIHQQRLDANDAFEAAYAAEPDPQLATVAFLVMKNSGHCDLARRWHPRIMRRPLSGFDRWMQDLVLSGARPVELEECAIARPREAMADR